MKLVKRVVHFYEIVAKQQEDYTVSTNYDTAFQELLSSIVKMVGEKSPLRYQVIGEKSVFINDIKFEPTAKKNVVIGKLLSVRKDLFPEVIDTLTDDIKGIEALEHQGIVETTHFLIEEPAKNKSNKIKLCIEYNQFGGRIMELVFYLTKLSLHFEIFKEIKFIAITRNILHTYEERIGKISKITIKIKKDDITALENVDTGLGTVFKTAQEVFEDEYVSMEFKYDILEARKFPQLEKARKPRNIVSSFISYLLQDVKSNTSQFQKVEVIAEDEDNFNRLKAFDLLIDKVKDEFKVQKVEKFRTVVSIDMFSKMKESFTKFRL